MRASEIAGLIIVASIASAVAAPIWDAQDGAVLSVKEAPGLLSQCSRSAPHSVSSYWLPQRSQIDELEARLPGALDEAFSRRSARESSDPSGTLRQYAGLMLGERKIIYVNGIAKVLVEDEMRSAKQLGRPIRDWRTSAWGVCDGGPAFFGVEYDPLTRTFANFAFNGSA